MQRNFVVQINMAIYGPAMTSVISKTVHCCNEPCYKEVLVYLSRDARKRDFRLCENKGADQLCSNCTADQHLCFRHSDSTISVLPKSEISSFLPSSETVQACLCRTRSETPKTGFLTSGLISIATLSCPLNQADQLMATEKCTYKVVVICDRYFFSQEQHCKDN